MGVYIGADLGGTHFRLAFRLAEAPNIRSEVVTLPSDERWDSATILTLIRDYAAGLSPDLGPVLGVGLGMTGDVDPATGVTEVAPRFPRLSSTPLGERLRRGLDLPTFVMNDGLAAALGELTLGAGRGVRSFLLLTLGTGIGCGLVANNRVLAGPHGRWGRAGHQILEIDGPVYCHCGLPGCWQSLAGKRAVEHRALDVARSHPESPLARLLAQGGGVDLAAVSELASHGDGASADVLTETGRLVGIGAANLIKCFAPELVLIGGGIAERGGPLLQSLERTVARYAVKPYQRVPVRPAGLGKDAGVFGATVLAEGLAHVRME